MEEGIYAYTDIIAYFAGLFIAVAFIPQAMKTYKTRSIESLSLASFIILVLGTFGMTIYAALMQQYDVVIFNLISLLFDVLILYAILRFGKKIAE